MSQFSRGKKQNQVTQLQVTQCSFQAIQVGKKSSPDGQKKPQQTNQILLCVPLIKYICIVILQFCSKPNVNNCLMLSTACIRVLTTIPTRGHSSLGRTTKGFKAAHTRTQQFYWFITLKQHDPAAAPTAAAGQGLSAFLRADLFTGVSNPAQENHTGT